MYSSVGQLTKGKPIKASSFVKSDVGDFNKDATSDSRLNTCKDTKKRQRSPTTIADQATQSGNSGASGWTAVEEEQRKQNGRPVTWVGGGGLDMKYLCTLGVPRLRQIFLDVFGHHTASNNGGWLRRKLAEPAEGGRGRALQIRARDASAAIWTTGKVRGVMKAEATAIAAQRQAEKRAERENASAERAGRSSRHATGPESLLAGLTPPRAPPPQATAAARVTSLFKDELLGVERTTYSTRSTAPSRDIDLFGSETHQAGTARLIMKKSDLWNKGAMNKLAVQVLWQDDGTWWPAKIAQVDSTSISVEYDGGESETLCTSEVLRDGILSLGWVKARACSETPTDPCSDAGSANDHERILERSQEPDENIHNLVCFEEAFQQHSQDDLDVTEPSSKKAKLIIPALDLFSPPVSRNGSESVTSTPSALLPIPVPHPNTPLDPATCMWADACLATAHRPTPAVERTLNLTHPSSSSARPKSASRSSSKAPAQSSHLTGSRPSSSSKTWLDSPSLLGRSRGGQGSTAGGVPRATPVTLGFMSPPMRPPGSSRSKLSSLGLTSPLGRVPIDSGSNVSSVASASVPARTAQEAAPANAASFSFLNAASKPQFQSLAPFGPSQSQYQRQGYSGIVYDHGAAAAISQQGRAIAQLPSFAAAFGSMFSPPARPVNFGPVPRQGIPMQPLGRGTSVHPSTQGLPSQLHSTMQPYAQTHGMPSSSIPQTRLASAPFSMPQCFATIAPQSYPPQGTFAPAIHGGETMPRATTLDMLLGTDKLRGIARPGVHLPVGAVQVPTSAAFQASNPSFFDSVTAFADGFALPGRREQSFGWASAGCADASAITSTYAMDAVEVFESDAAAVKLHELSEDGTLSHFDSEQMLCDSDV